MDPVDTSKITIDTLTLPVLKEKKISLQVLRLDKIHPLISGNKWFKLRYYLEEAKRQDKKNLVTFGGAWSNHILATAAAAQSYQFSSTGIIRGEQPANYSSTLLKARSLGMNFIFLKREEYKLKQLPSFLMNDRDSYIIPEGGYGENGAAGASTIEEFCKGTSYTHICCAAGTGTMLAGLLRFRNPAAILGISVLKNNCQLGKNIDEITSVNKVPVIVHDYHFGGYAKYTNDLLSFMNNFYKDAGIPSDFVYTGKLFYGVFDLIEKNSFPAGSHILVIHSGGLQGNESLDKGTLIF
jgi:1-aminocyclopropane-1-carboxylate deaminase